ncbi:L-selectin-like [Micropterus salmoides]|uniref:L-selectin-like n=1 Tax=Micropterus salmoides TaxID=27706 RepID=UPI0018EA637B|nr:L-selectin-like [Micropterus salmoides]
MTVILTQEKSKDAVESVSAHSDGSNTAVFSLVLGQCSFFICHLYEYHFIGENKTWDEAQKYCRENYTDLATVTNMTDVRRLLDATVHNYLNKAADPDFVSIFSMTDKVILIKESKNWMETLYYCRENYSDLVSITNPHQQRWVQERAKNADSIKVWLGLRYTCTLDLWFWVSDELVCYENWATDKKPNGCDLTAAMDSKKPHKWHRKRETVEFNFICAV